jgi:hypothetical protein
MSINQRNIRIIWSRLRRSVRLTMAPVFGPRALASAVAVGLAFSATSAYAGNNVPGKESFSTTIKTITDYTNDLEITFHNTAPFDFTSTDDWNKRGFDHSQGTHAGDPTDKSGAAIFDGASFDANTEITISFETTSDENQFIIDGAFWTHHDLSPADPIPGLKGQGFKASAVGDPQIDFTIMNDSADYHAYSNLSFLSNSPELPLNSIPGSIPGFAPFDPFLLLAPGQSADFLFPDMDPGNWLYIEASTYVSDVSGDQLSDSSLFDFGHQKPVPEASTWDMMLTGFGGLGFAAFWRVRRATLPVLQASRQHEARCATHLGFKS